jgi:two-component system sensor histidine kinase CpxA
MKVRFPLVSKMVVLLVVYVALLPLLAFFILDTQYGFGWDTILHSPLGERADTVGRLVVSQLRSSPKGEWNDELKRLNDTYHVQFYLFDFFGKQLAGESIALPAVLKERLEPPPRGPFEMHGFGSGLPFHGGPPPFGPPEFQGDGPMDGPGGPPAPFDMHDQGKDFDPPFGNGPPLPPPNESAMHVFHEGSKFVLHTDNPSRFWICQRLPMFVQHGGPPLVTLLAASDNPWQNSLLFDIKAVLIAAATVLAFSALFWFPFIYRISKDLSELTVATEHIAEGRFDTRLEVNRGDEVARLADAINSMSAKLNTFVAGQKRFLGDIAHELCSPIARLQMALELLSQRANGDQSSQIADIREEVVEISNLVNELLAFSKAGLKASQPELKAIELFPVVNDVVSKLSAQSLVSVNVPDTFTVLGDRLLIERAIANVVRNSIRYASSFGLIEIRAIKVAENIFLSISDQGPGVPEDSIAHLGEPFFRPAPARDRQTGGFGLGLAIVKSCIESCDGSVAVSNRKPNGFLVEFKLRAFDLPQSKEESTPAETREGQIA